MNPEIKAKWIEALRSGKYKQARGRLRVDDGFCCFGVLCEITSTPYEDHDTHAPKALLRAAGLDSAGSTPTRVEFHGGRAGCLIDLNDFGADFNFIADVIEKQL